MIGVEGESRKVEEKYHADACAVAATSRPWVMMTVQIQTPAPKPLQNVHSLLRGMLSDVPLAWTSVLPQPSELLSIIP